MWEHSTALQVRTPNHLSMIGTRLLVLNGPDRPRALQLDKEEVVLGTSEAADLRLTDPAVSRLHASIRTTYEGFLLTDLDSKNGTSIGKQRIKSAYLDLGDVISIGKTKLRFEATRKSVELPLSADESFGLLHGRSAAARRLFALLEQVADTHTTVLLTGETGVGKDACAESLHRNSSRASGPFIVVDCGALSEGIAESELFGHVKGAFTGALQTRRGAFAEASGGTLFIDEVGELPRALQPKLLRALEKREVRPVGSDQSVAVDVRIIAATNRDLKLQVNQGTFRDDLFYRLSVVSIHVPALRERLEDVPLLANLFWSRITNDPDSGCPASLLQSFLSRRWPGNVRELYNKVEEAVTLNKEELTDEHPRPSHPSYREARREAIDLFQRSFLTALMERADGNVAQAARLATMDRIYLTKLLRTYGIRSR
jgi:transcriptional regulator with GAF, ATPase, and Fis domain